MATKISDEEIYEIAKNLLSKTSNEIVSVSADNIFSILDKEWDERTHCRILFFLIKHNSYTFANFIQENAKINLKDYHLLSQESCCEEPCLFIENCQYFERNKHGFIDILLVWENKNTKKKLFMPIEVKLGAEDQPLQLLRYYYNFSHKREEVRPIYLTTSGKNASETSTTCPYKNECDIDKCPKKLDEAVVTKISFKDVYENWLNKLTENAENDNNTISRELIKHYCEILKRWYKMGEYIDLIKEKKDRFIAAKNIYNSFGGMIEEIRQKFFNAICEEAGTDYIKLPYEGNAQKKNAKEQGWSDFSNIELILNFGGADLAICVGTNLYCRRNKKNAQNDHELDEWCYIKKDWFERSISDGYQSKKGVINGKDFDDDDNYIVEWYYSKDKQEQAISNLVTNLKRYALHDINLHKK